MGLFDKMHAELVDIVEWVDDSRSTLVWRFPRYQNQIKNGAQLIVRPGQMAVFVHQGQIADRFGPGHYMLHSRNLPVLSTLAGWKYGFDSPFKAEVYFVSSRQIADLKWGTPNPVPIRDHDFGPIRVRAFGTYTLRAADPKILLQQLVGTESVYEAEEIAVLLRSIIASAFADLVASADISVVDLATHYQELSEKLRQMVLERVDDEYGLDIPQLVLVNVSVPEEVEKALDSRSSMRVIEDLAQYQQYQIGASLPTAAANPAGALAGAGLGAGVGVALAGRMAAGAAGPAAAGQAPPPPPPTPSTWHVAENGQSTGPLTLAQLVQAAASGRLRPETLVWTAGMAGWVAAGQVPQLASLWPPPLPPS
jgi:membrane protease subunit (stomatin/prohibitin family)